MSETDRAAKDRRHARIDALTDDQRLFLLDFLVGYAPEAADAALDDLEDARYVREHGGDDLDTGHVRDPAGDEAAHG